MRRLMAAILTMAGLAPLSACTATIGVKDVYMSLDSSGARRRTTFFTDSDAIVCVIEYSAGRADATLEGLIRQQARFDFTSNGLTNADRITGSIDQPATKGANQVLALTLTKNDPITGEAKDDLPFSPGRYVCEVRIDGKVDSTAPFTIDFPPCPAAQIRPRTVCLGFYKNDTECPAFGASSKEPGTCKCNGPGGTWTC